jgi:hypothetical protein
MLLYKLPVIEFNDLNHPNLITNGVYIEYGDLEERDNYRDISTGALTLLICF